MVRKIAKYRPNAALGHDIGAWSKGERLYGGGKRARELGIKRVPSVVIDGALAECCAAGIDEQSLRRAGLGSSL
jgi:hypothetical protein